jgi:hypothetical protein
VRKEVTSVFDGGDWAYLIALLSTLKKGCSTEILGSVSPDTEEQPMKRQRKKARI